MDVLILIHPFVAVHQQIVALLNKVFSKFDELTDTHNVYKVETIGDVYLVASGCPREYYRPDHAAILSVVATAMHQGRILLTSLS
jgi:adenylate cyclase